MWAILPCDFDRSHSLTSMEWLCFMFFYSKLNGIPSDTRTQTLRFFQGISANNLFVLLVFDT